MVKTKDKFHWADNSGPYKKSTWIHTCDFMWNHVITCEIMWSYVKFNMWKNFIWNHMWNFTNERVSHKITYDVSHVKGFHMKSHISHVKGFHTKSHVTLHMWKDFTWNHMYFTWNYTLNFTCKRSSHQIINYKWNFTCERISHEITNYEWNFTCERISSWAYGKEKIRRAERNLPDIFRLCPRFKKNFPEKLSKIVVDGVEEWLRKIPIR
jgi:hypothetical protein